MTAVAANPGAAADGGAAPATMAEIAPAEAGIDVSPDAPFEIVLNDGSGRNDKSEIKAQIAGVLEAAGRRYVLRSAGGADELRAAAEAAVAAARAHGGVVVAAGGDGTINTVAQQVLGSGCPFGVLPQGTFNYFSRTHGITSDTVEATRLLLTARAYPVQVGLVNDRLFLVNASLGLYPQLLEDREAYKKQYGRSRPVALWAAVMTLLREHRQLRLRLELEGRSVRLRTPTLFIGNNRLQLLQIGMPEARCVERGCLAAIMVKPVGTLRMLWLLVRGALGKLGDAEHVRSFPFDEMRVQPWLPYGRHAVKLAVDGEISRMRTPLVFRVAPEPLMLLRPGPGEMPDPEQAAG